MLKRKDPIAYGSKMTFLASLTFSEKRKGMVSLGLYIGGSGKFTRFSGIGTRVQL
ncbi:MAG: hypothetical protein SPL20_04450 [Fibrobacter sp.]|nr:hypothetical protein [Fibrobacter sp.]